MNIAIFDAQWIDVMTGWLIYTAGYSVHSAFYAASRNLPDPYLTEWRKLNHEVESGIYESLSEGLQDLAKRIPSGALKLVADTFYQNWIGEASSYGLHGDVEKILKILWQNYGPQPAPSVTDFHEILSLLRQFDVNDDHIRRQLLELGDHLIPYLIGYMDMQSSKQWSDLIFDLLKSLNTPEAIRHTRRYVVSDKPANRQAARQALRELGIHVNAPQYLDFEGSGKSVDLYLKVNLEPEDILKIILDLDKGFQNDQPEPPIAVHASKVDDKTTKALIDLYEFAPTVHLHFDIPHLRAEQATYAPSSRSPEGKEVIKKILRITFDRLRNTDWEIMLMSDLMGLILMRKSGELLLNQNGFWVDANQEEVTTPYTQAKLPFAYVLYPER